ncbi:hypothetical protein VARIO8X_110307 [Burkholderiales bacterium 8X]|nr:hypothetical protein VARIO8X_110307 [Burkholderiales bacterium 8X]
MATCSSRASGCCRSGNEWFPSRKHWAMRCGSSSPTRSKPGWIRSTRPGWPGSRRPRSTTRATPTSSTSPAWPASAGNCGARPNNCLPRQALGYTIGRFISERGWRWPSWRKAAATMSRPLWLGSGRRKQNSRRPEISSAIELIAEAQGCTRWSEENQGCDNTAMCELVLILRTYIQKEFGTFGHLGYIRN